MSKTAELFDGTQLEFEDGTPDHDIRMIQSLRGPLPLVGFFANGEIGPIGDKNYIHGYTSSLAIIK